MNPIYQIWWRLLMDLRPVVRYLAERFPHLSPAAVRLRSLAHFLVGSPAQVLVSAYSLTVWSLAGSFKWGFAAWLSAAIGNYCE